MSFDAARLAAVVSPLRRAILGAARRREGLPELPDGQIEVIRALPRGTVASPSELAASLGLGRPTVSNLLSRMERDGLVARTPRAGDGRGVDVAASAHALDLFVRFDRASTAIVADAASALTPEDLAALDAALPALERLRDLLVDLRHGDAASGGGGADGDAEGLA
ncbi:MarR family winged helix-turn-helix transcriptional regulator [Agromyces binzhouensis]|uniref:MarR family transcriptional regulator n=1 Tax=Agromyces binzhouensis TaxID=1817495 RepID=A0A4V1QSY9_9MICO|nr:MarR family transcriptional regulator [Agromyces binzhouensis]RXZ50053.1 MarR family transcriptional regulator [Agromyces binzhouensis]